MSSDPSVNNNNALMVPTYDKIPLSHILEAAVQKTYHSLYTMADVLHSKPNFERKTDLLAFACRTRQLFIRILALVKWAETTEKVTIYEEIQNLLEEHAQLIRHTSDTLAQLAREKLIDARVPNFPMTDAIDGLTLGTVNFLPKRIAEITTIFTSATESEQQEILPRLHQILTARVSSSDLPIEFTDVIIKNGLVTLIVDGEFEVRLGVINDSLTSPWRIYEIKLFLCDTEEPEQELVHPSQLQVLTNFIQSWLNESEKPLTELYRYLHYYCQVLRLQILFEQAHRIRNQGSKQKDLILSNYTACKSFNIEYWKDYNSIVNANQTKKPNVQGKSYDIGMTILCNDEGILHIEHWPPLPIDDSMEIQQILKKQIFTMEEILNRTIFARCQRRFEELKESILSTTIAHIEIDSSIPVLKCELLSECSTEEILFISISPFSGLFKAVCYMETRFCQQIENALNRDQTNLIDSLNQFKLWLIQQRIPTLLAHINCRIYTQIPSINPQNPLIIPYLNQSIFIGLNNHEGFYIVVFISDINQLLVQYFLLIVEKRYSLHESFVTQEQTINNNEGVKWLLEPLVLSPLDPTIFFRKELFQFKDFFPLNTNFDNDDDDDEEPENQSMSMLSIKSLIKFVNYYDEMLSLIIIKDNLQKKKALCKNILYCPWTGIPYLDIVRTSIDDENELLNENDLVSYINEYFWPRIQSCSIRIVYTLSDANRDMKPIERQWTIQLNLSDKNYFHQSLIKTPNHSLAILTSKTYSKLNDQILNEIRSAYEITHLIENYSFALAESIDLPILSKIVFFNFFKCTISFGPNFAFTMTLSYNSNRSSSDINSNIDGTFELRFVTINNQYLSVSHQYLNKKLVPFLNQTHSLKQLIRLLHITSIPLSSITRLNSFKRPIVFANQGGCPQTLLTFIPYTETRWRLMFAQTFSIDIQICGPNLILIRDGSFSVQLNQSLNELAAIPKFKEFLSKYADDRGLTFEFSDITEQFHIEDFLVSDLLTSIPPPSSTSTIDESIFMDTNDQTSVRSPTDIYDAIFRDTLPSSSTATQSNSKSQFEHIPILHSYNRELFTKANYPIYMSQERFFQILYTSDRHQWSRLEAFLASSILIRQFAKAVTDPPDANNSAIRSIPNEHDTYRLEHLSLEITFEFHIPSSSYQIHLITTQDSANSLTNEEIQIFETFLNRNFFPISPITNFSTPSIDILTLFAPQNTATAMGSFERMLTLIQPRLLKDLIKIIRLENNPESHHLWSARWCITIPQGNGFSQVGHPAIYYHSVRSSFLFMFQFTSQVNQNETPSTFIVPLLYDTNSNQTSFWEGSSKHPKIGNESKYQLISKILSTFKETFNKNECSLYQAIVELVTRLQVSTTLLT